MCVLNLGSEWARKYWIGNSKKLSWQKKSAEENERNWKKMCSIEFIFVFFLVVNVPYARRFTNNGRNRCHRFSCFDVRKFSESVHFTSDIFLEFSPFFFSLVNLSMLFIFLVSSQISNTVRFVVIVRFPKHKDILRLRDTAKQKQNICVGRTNIYNLLKCYFYRC